MADFLKTPLSKSLNRFAEKKVATGIQATGRALPCSVSEVISSGIVRVKFEVDAAPFTLPELVVAKWGAEYIRYPTQVGDKGYVSTAAARLGGMTGLGAGTPSLTQPGNLAALVWNPLGNTAWDDVDPNVLVMYGPEGVEIRDADSLSVISVTPTTITMTRSTATVTLTATTATMARGGNSVAVTGAGVAITGVLTINGSPYLAHTHGGVQVGAGVTGGVV